MTVPSPIHELLTQYEMSWSQPKQPGSRESAATGFMQERLLCEFLPWGEEGCSVLATTGIVELEYAAIRKSVGLFDAPCRGTILLEGEDCLPFIDRMTTQKLSNMTECESRLAFVTDRKGRIIADVIVACDNGRAIIDCDVTVVKSLLEHLEMYVVADDVHITNTTQEEHRLWLIGPASNTLDVSSNTTFSLPKQFLGLEGIAMSVSPNEAGKVWEKYINQEVRPIGWYALNMARVEECTPVFRIDYDSKNLPHETSCCSSRVRFDKGCYLGQEVVARMESLGQPKQLLVRLEIPSGELPVSGSEIWNKQSEEGGKVIGVVTSSAISPMRGGDIVVIAMVKKNYAQIGSTVYPWIGSKQVKAVVCPLSSKEEVE